MPKLLSVETYRALRAAGADDAEAERGAADVGSLWHEVGCPAASGVEDLLALLP